FLRAECAFVLVLSVLLRLFHRLPPALPAHPRPFVAPRVESGIAGTLYSLGGGDALAADRAHGVAGAAVDVQSRRQFLRCRPSGLHRISARASALRTFASPLRPI